MKNEKLWVETRACSGVFYKKKKLWKKTPGSSKAVGGSVAVSELSSEPSQ